MLQEKTSSKSLANDFNHKCQKTKDIVYSVLILQALLQLVCMPESFHEHTCKQTPPQNEKIIFWMLPCPIGLSNAIQTEGPGSLSQEEQTLEAVLAPLP
jgi:hypothetical protein